MRAQKIAILAAIVGGLAVAFLLLRTQADPCGALLRRYVAAYEGLKPCGADAECVLDPIPVGGPGVCDRARAASGDRASLVEIERAWEKRCPAPGNTCPPLAGTRCEKKRCVTLVAR